MKRKKFRIPRKRIAAFCQRWNITEFSLFGSALRDDFRPDSDVDVLVSIDTKAKNIGLFEIIDMKLELETMFKRPVDLVEKEGLRNPYRRKEILRTAQVIYNEQASLQERLKSVHRQIRKELVGKVFPDTAEVIRRERKKRDKQLLANMY